MFLRAFGHGIAAWIWLDLSLSAEAPDSSAHRAGVNYVLRYFIENELPVARSWLSIVDQYLDTAVEVPLEVFS
ncbi:MAG: acyl-CoA dehydrogenase C-terminal domain-containing protein [Henriciella sp.]|nr:acyl-CoA dehydrogenase C-terminal domain-containing protein [Henriciella sp.]